jgi:hypothetical protein
MEIKLLYAFKGVRSGATNPVAWQPLIAQLLVKMGTTSFEKLAGPVGTGTGTIVFDVQAASKINPRIANAIFLSLHFFIFMKFNFER